MPEGLPSISLAGSGTPAGNRAIGREIEQALTAIGCFVLTDHGVAAEVIADAERESLAFFDLPAAAKQCSANQGADSPRGYLPFRAENLGATTGAMTRADLRDGFSLGPLRVTGAPHRVDVPPSEAGPDSRRLSLTYFCNPDDALEIACLPGCCGADHPARYAPMTAGAHRYNKIKTLLTA